jgi:cobalt/nickel transport system permease protein
MHIPDGFINAPTAVATGVVAAGTVAYALKESRGQLEDRQVPVVALTGAFIFAVQMLNFPVGLGTSGHLIGGTLAAILLGPWVAALVLSIVLLVQGLLFADGGITALGANITLMGLVAGTGGYYLFRALAAALPKTRGGFLGATAITSWASVVVASALASVFLVLNGFPTATFGVMVGLHALIGIGEAVITTIVVGAVMTARPDVMATRDLLPAAGMEPRRAAA